MAIRYKDHIAVLEDHCSVEEAESFLEWMKQQSEPMVDLGGCSHLHAAILQVLLALRPVILVPPEDSFLRRLPLDWAQLPAALPAAAGAEAEGEADAAVEPPPAVAATPPEQSILPEDGVEAADADTCSSAGGDGDVTAGGEPEARPRKALQEPLPVHLGPADRRHVEEKSRG